MIRALLLALLFLTAVPAHADDRPVLYYKDPMGKPDYSPVPKKDGMGMDFVPVYEESDDTPPPKPQGRIRFYRNPMGLPDTSPVPKKDPMGMDYIPVYDGDEPDDAGTVKLTTAKIQRLGVRTASAGQRELARVIRATGTVQPDERRQTVFSTRFDGWIEHLHVATTGQAVHRGDALMDVYAPDLVAAQQEYRLASRASADGLLETARMRLLNLGFTDTATLQRGGAQRVVTLHAPADGIVLEKNAVEGMRFAAGEALYRMADLSVVWVVAEVFEQDLAWVPQDAPARITLPAWPDSSFDGVVTFIYPVLSRETRTVRVRIELPNPGLQLKLEMFAQAEIRTTLPRALTVPDSAILDTGQRQTVLLARGNGVFEPRAVTLGDRADGYVQIRNGLRDGDQVVVGANFLIDAESNMKAALRAFSAPDKTP
jgi:Cu(I)/Ag(I) efflux system membrane fusion protein